MALNGAFISLCSLSVHQMTLQQSIFTGACVGASASILLFFTVDAYHTFIMWQFTHLWYLLPCAFIGAAVAYVTD